MKRFGMHVFILVGLVLLITLPTIGLMNYLNASAETSGTYENTKVGGVDISDMTTDEASLRLNQAIEDFNVLPFSVNLMDGTMIEIAKDVVSFDVAKSLASIEEPGDYPLEATIDETRVTPYIENQPVTESMLIPLMNEAASSLNSTITFEQVAAENEVVASFTVSQTPAIQSVLDRMNGLELTAGDIFSLKAFGEDMDVLSKLGPSLYRMFAATPFEILERVPHTKLPPGVELGYDVKIDVRSNFAVQNRETSTYTMLVLYEGNTATVQLLGQPFSNAYETRVEEVMTVPYPKVIRFSSALPSGTSTVTQTGKTGQSGKLYRIVVKGDTETAELLGFDFYEPTPEIVTKSSVPAEGPAPSEPVIPTFPDDEVEEDEKDEPPVLNEDPSDQGAVG